MEARLSMMYEKCTEKKEMLILFLFCFCLGVYCGVLASVVDPSKKLPEVGAYKLMHISDKKNEAECMWPLEVQELSNFVLGKVTFSLKDL